MITLATRWRAPPQNVADRRSWHYRQCNILPLPKLLPKSSGQVQRGPAGHYRRRNGRVVPIMCSEPEWTRDGRPKRGPKWSCESLCPWVGTRFVLPRRKGHGSATTMNPSAFHHRWWRDVREAGSMSTSTFRPPGLTTVRFRGAETAHTCVLAQWHTPASWAACCRVLRLVGVARNPNGLGRS